ncbi:DUF6493 family protein [Spirillospora sp. NPDC048819]|uniref:DUF6493 family protein n=1 Tax=Spirillospora sp. NPDC048819 TaxID=3155268 RepID=UPI0033DC2208
MSAWDEVGKAIDGDDAGQTARLVMALDDAGRREVAKELPGKLKEMRAASDFGFLEREAQESLLLAGAGTISGAAAAAAWLCRRDLRIFWDSDRFAALCKTLCAVTAVRPDEWRAEVAHRLAARLRVAEETWFLWHIAAALIKSAGAALPVSDGFVAGWAADGARPQELDADPFLRTLVPRLFEVDGVGTVLANDTSRERWDVEHAGTLAVALAELARAGRLGRTSLLDGCVSRFLRGGTAHELRWFVRLHAALEPSEDEAAARARDYVRLLPAAPSTVADLALRQARRADEAGRLDTALFEEAAGALLFRPEKKLVRAALTWVDRTARKRDRVDAALRAVAAAFASEDLDLRERAVKCAAKHASHAGEPVRAEIRGAAAGLPAALRVTIAEAFGEVEASAEAEPPLGPPPFVPRESPAPIGSLSELGEEFLALQSRQEHWITTERFLAALTGFAYDDIDATRKAFSALTSWMFDNDHGFYTTAYTRSSWIRLPVLALMAPDVPRSPVISPFGSRHRVRGAALQPPMGRFLAWRRHEVAAAIGKVPVLLATPTEGSGHIDPDVLVRRLERLEETGTEPGEGDLVQAMLRVPREIDPAAAARAKGLTSEAGRTMASWLAQGGLADPSVECRVLDDPITTAHDRRLGIPTHVRATVDVSGDSGIARLWEFPEPDRRDYGAQGYDGSIAYWPSVLPSHREVAAAHLVPHQAGTGENDWGQGGILVDLAEADGPAGAATGTLLACALANAHQDQRAGAVEAFLTLSARGALPGGETGTALGRLAAFGHVTLPRVVKALASAADAGAHTEVWATLAAALPHALPAPGERAASGVPALLALGTRLAETMGVRGVIPAVGDVAARGGSSSLVKEAARLHRTLAT